MDILKNQYIILELIPSHPDSKIGEIIQLQALKLDGLKLIDRFNYRLDLTKINQEFLKIINYDNEQFTYVLNQEIILAEFQKFALDLPLLIIDNQYTKDYLKKLNNLKLSIFKYLGLELTDDVFIKLINKYNLKPTNHLVDLLYEALIEKSNYE